MNSSFTAKRENPLATLRRLAPSRAPAEQCEFCSLPLGQGHRHLLELAGQKIICACDPCALRFENVVGRWKLIPRDARLLPSFQMADATWEGFALPINLAFFFHSTRAGKMVALYPSPAGATESLLPLSSWQTLERDNPCLLRMERDVEALLVHRLGEARECYLAPIDVCYELVGIIRLRWRGLSGGDKVWEELRNFFARLKGQTAGSPAQPEAVHA
jgi:hypothetical protein